MHKIDWGFAILTTCMIGLVITATWAIVTFTNDNKSKIDGSYYVCSYDGDDTYMLYHNNQQYYFKSDNTMYFIENCSIEE